MRQPQSHTGLNIVGHDPHKRQITERFSIDPLRTNHQSEKQEHAKNVSACCAEILKIYKHHNNSSHSIIPKDVIKPIATKYNVSADKIERVMNAGRKRFKKKGSKK